MARYWWLNLVRGTTAFLIGLGLMLPVEVILQSEQLQGILFQFIGIYFLLSGIMSLIWGYSNRKRLGLWKVAGTLGIVGGILFFLRPSLEGTLSAALLTAVFGAIMLFAGVIHIVGGFRLGKEHGRRFTGGHAFLGLVEIAIGLLLFVSITVPVAHFRIMLSVWGLVAGVGLFAEGLTMHRVNKGEITDVES